MKFISNILKFLHMDEKKGAAFSSVIAAVFLTTIKLIVGIITGSLGILSEALHSLLDLVAAGVTFFAVHSSDKPADKDHQYGHGKIENLSALIETILLLITVIWILYEASRRIILKEYEIDTNIWAFIVVGIAIITDISRATMLKKTAEKYDSQALKADALHFSTDILSSSVVFIGLIFAKFGYAIADPIAAIGVAIIVLWITLQLGKESIDDLLDRAPIGLNDKIRQSIENIPGLTEISRIRIRKAGPKVFVDINVIIDDMLPLESGYHLVERMIKIVKKTVGGDVDVIVHLEPEVHQEHDIMLEDIKQIFLHNELIHAVHDISVIEMDKLLITAHIEVNEQLIIKDVDTQITLLKNKIKEKYSYIDSIVIHIEPYIGEKHEKFNEETIKEILPKLVERSKFLNELVSYNIHELGPNAYSLVIHCTTNPEYRIRRVHKASTELEDAIREVFPFFTQIIIQTDIKK